MQFTKFRNLFSVIVLLSSIVTSFIQTPLASAAGCPAKPYLVAAPTIGVAGEYAVWLQAKQPADSAAKVHVSTDGGTSCQEFKKGTTSWGWVSGAGGTTKMILSAGAASIRIYVEGGEAHLANLLLTLDTSCVPTGDGSNCVQQPLQLSVAGIQQGDTVSGSVIVETFVANKTINGARVEYYLDGASTPYSTSTQSPYCLVLTANKCAGWPSSSLSNGQHKLTIRGISEGNPTEKIITFTVNNASATAPTPTPSPTPSPTPTPSPSPSPTPSPTPVSSPSPSPVASPTTSPNPSPSPSSTPTSSPSPTPTPSPTPATQATPRTNTTNPVLSNLDKATIADATPTGVVEKLDETNDTARTTNGTALVAGLSVAGTLKGTVIITTPKDVILEVADMVELLVDGKLIETKTVETPVTTASFSLDTTKLKNGKSVISMRVTRENGEISTYSSNVEIANGTVASTVGTAKKGWLSIVMSVLGIAILLVSLGFLVRYIMSKRQYEEDHNIQNYTYVQPENPYYPAAGATLAILFAVFAVFTVRGSSNAANVGYIYKLNESTLPQEFSMANDTTENLAYVNLSDTTGTPTSPTPPVVPPPVTPPTTPPITPPVTPPITPPNPPVPSDGKYDVFTFGDSLTFGMVYSKLLETYNSFGLSADTNYTANGIEITGHSVRAKPGWGISNVQGVASEHQQDLAKAELIVVELGSNHSPYPDFSDEMLTLIKTIHGYSPNAKILWVNTFFVNTGNNPYIIKDGKIIHLFLNPIIANGVEKGRAAGIDVSVLDFEGAINRGEMIAPDRDHVHFSSQGEALQGKWLAGQVKKAAGL